MLPADSRRTRLGIFLLGALVSGERGKMLGSSHSSVWRVCLRHHSPDVSVLVDSHRQAQQTQASPILPTEPVKGAVLSPLGGLRARWPPPPLPSFP